jgi:hypothetical protein
MKKSKKPAESKKPTAPKAIPTEAADKMAKWNKAHPEDMFSWVVIADDTPAAQKSAVAAKKNSRWAA